jgi:uncharacterized protein YndB with AHSA1/START domain
MTERSTVHGSFVLERTYPATPARVFAAFSDPEAKKQWFNGPADLEPSKYSLDFQVGGREYLEIVMPDGGPVFSYDSCFQDIVAGERIIHTYDMHLDGQRMSVSVATIEFVPAGDAMTLRMTEHGVFLDGLDTNEQRREGTADFFDLIAKYLEESA